LGEDVTRRTDGTYLFPNCWDDTIKIKTLAQVGDSWTFYQDSSTIYYNAEVTAIDTMTVLGVVDSVKTILLTAYDNGIPLLTDSFNNSQIILSKDHGFYQIMELYLFPFHYPDTGLIVNDYYFTNSIKPADFNPPNNSVIPGPYPCMFRLVNYVAPIRTAIHNWSVGDVYEYSSCHGGNGWSACTQTNFYKLDTIVNKTVFADSIIYQTTGWRSAKHYPDTYFDLWAASGSVKHINTEVDLFEAHRMPEEFDPSIPPIWGPVWPILYYYPDDISYCTQSPLYISFFYSHPGLSGVTGHHIYKTDVGTVKDYLWVYDGTSPTDYDTTLIYFTRTGVPCGTYAFGDTTKPVVNYITNINAISPINIYPNPASEQLTIETGLAHYKLSLVNAIGQVVYNKDGCDNKQVIDVGHFTPGIYQLRIETEGHSVTNRKVIIQK
jgi:hypothetical protein